jgi:ABC-type molybdate transport system substrate-binding protein
MRHGPSDKSLLSEFRSLHYILSATTEGAIRNRFSTLLASAFTDLLRRFPASPDTAATPEFGPSGLMREQIEAGADIDLFASADMAQARRLALGHPERFVVNFTRNRLCGVARGALGLTPGEHAGSLADLTVRLATSTPGADPAGDYAWAVFARAESMRPGARAALEAKAQRVCEQRAGEFLRALLSRSKTLLVCN